MLPRRSRLRTQEVEAVMRLGKSVRGRFLSAKILPPGGGATIKIAAVVPKAVAKKAVVRNRLRRALYRALASLPEQDRGFFRGRNAAAILRVIPTPPVETALRDDLLHIIASL